MQSNSEEETRDWYTRYYREKGADRNDLLNNPEVMFQHLASERSVLRALRATSIVDRTAARVLDVGCGSGGSLLRFLSLGFPPANLQGVDIIADRIQEARARLPGVRFEVADATALPFADASFDVVFESTMFVQITDETMATKIAAEMLRVTRPGGHVMLIDWRYSKPGNSNYLGVSRRRIRRLFDLPARGDLVHTSRGSLIPPVGRFLSKYLPALYSRCPRCCPSWPDKPQASSGKLKSEVAVNPAKRRQCAAAMSVLSILLLETMTDEWPSCTSENDQFR